MSETELARLRADLEDTLLPGTANILLVTRTPDGQGGFTDVWGTAVANVACRVDFKQGMEQGADWGYRPFSFWQLTFPQGTNLTAANRVEVGTITYSISAVDAGNSWDACLRATGAKL
jgi:hypothetical protein